MKTSRKLDELEAQKLAQTKSSDAATLNLTRRTGDLAVYGNKMNRTQYPHNSDISQATTLELSVL